MSLSDDLERIQHPVPRFYLAAVVGSLLIVGLILVERGMGSAAFLVLVLGGLGLYTRAWYWPPLVIGLVALVLLARAQGHDLVSWFYRQVIPWSRLRAFHSEYQPEPLLDAFLVLVLLVYLQGQYRLIGYLSRALPQEGQIGSDQRRPILRELPPMDTGEGLRGATVLAFVVVAAIFTWILVSTTGPPVDLSREVWHGLLLAWLLATALLGTSTIVRIAFWREASRDVHRMFLQEVLWRETRGDQARVNRWIVQARLKAQKRREK